MPQRVRPLKVGDRIRIVRLPPDWETAEYKVSREMRSLYRTLIARRRPVTITEIDFDVPWIHCQTREKDGRKVLHWVVIDDGCWVRVVPRRRPREPEAAKEA
ncbi:MAG TPA: hypothetical protein VF796_25675 [Humisphaera sp.]